MKTAYSFQMGIIFTRSLSLAILLSISIAAKSQHREQIDEGKLIDYYQNQQFSEAAIYLNQFYDASNPDWQLMERLGYSYRMAGDDRQAEYFYLKLHQLDSLHIPTLLSLSQINTKRLQYEQAQDFLHQIIYIDSTNLSALLALARVSGNLKQENLQYKYLKLANSLRPTNSDIAYDFSQICIQSQKYGEADTVLQIALEEDPDHRLLLLTRAKITNQLKNYQETIRLCEHMIETGYRTPDVLNLLARASFFEKMYVKSIDIYQEILNNKDFMSELDLYYFAMAYKAEKQYKNANAMMDLVLKAAISPNSAFYYGVKADLHDLANQPSAAVQNYLKSFHFDIIPNHYYSLALVYDLKLSDPRNALRYYRTYLQQELPEDEQHFVKYVRERIKELDK